MDLAYVLISSWRAFFFFFFWWLPQPFPFKHWGERQQGVEEGGEGDFRNLLADENAWTGLQ